MSTQTIEPKTALVIWRDLIQPDARGMTREAAMYFMKLRFSKKVLERVHKLAVKNQAGALSPAELAEMNSYRQVGLQLDILKAKARLTLRASGK